MKAIIAIGSLLMLLILSMTGISAQPVEWERLETPMTGVVSVYGSSNESVFAETQSGGLFRSTDYGDTWRLVRALESDERAGLVAASDGIVLLVRSNTVLVSIDDGETWRDPVAPFGGGDTITAVFVSSLGMFVGLTNGFVYHSTDTASTWEMTELPYTPCPVTMFIDYRGKNILVGTECGAPELKLRDGEIIGIGGFAGGYHIYDIVAFDVSVGIATKGGFYRAPSLGSMLIDNGNDRWRNTVVTAMDTLDGSTIYASTRSDGILRSTDQGFSWDYWNFNLGIVEDYVAVVCPDDRILSFTADSVYRIVDSTSASSDVHQLPSDPQLMFHSYLQGDRLVISGSESLYGVRSIRIYNLLGQEVSVSQQVHRTSPIEIAVDVGSLPSGIYFVELRTEDGVAGICQVGIW